MTIFLSQTKEYFRRVHHHKNIIGWMQHDAQDDCDGSSDMIYAE